MFLIGRAYAFMLKEEWRVRRRFYHRRAFAECDLALKRAYLFCNPYRLVECYGETPLTTLAQIAEEADLSAQDTLIDLGCGRGRGVFFLAHALGCSVKGIEKNSHFVTKAQAIQEHCAIKNASFECVDMLDADLSGATAIYLYGTCLEEASLEKLIEKFRSLPRSTKLISVSYPLAHFVLKKQITVAYPWGKTEVYFHDSR